MPKRRVAQEQETRMTATIPLRLKRQFDHEVIDRGLKQRELLIELLEAYFQQKERAQKT
jgi:metal-responsive CopG/Arc/MetJ family transcriptional regulator